MQDPRAKYRGGKTEDQILNGQTITGKTSSGKREPAEEELAWVTTEPQTLKTHTDYLDKIGHDQGREAKAKRRKR